MTKARASQSRRMTGALIVLEMHVTSHNSFSGISHPFLAAMSYTTAISQYGTMAATLRKNFPVWKGS